MRKIIFSLCVALAFIGCTNDFSVDVPLSKLDANKTTVTGYVGVEVPACNSHEDSRMESDSVLKLKSQMPQLAPGAVFKECYSKNFNSYAVFELPVVVGADIKSKDLGGSAIGIIKDTQNNYVVMAIGKKMREDIAKAQKSAIGSSNFRIFIKFINDTGSQISNVLINDSFVDGKISIQGDYNVPENAAFTVMLNNVRTSALLSTDKEFGMAPVFNILKQ